MKFFQVDTIIVNSNKIINRAILSVENHRVTDICPIPKFKMKSNSKIVELKGILAPVFINCHTHIELSGIPRIEHHINFFDWVSKLNEARKKLSKIENELAIRQVLTHAKAHGTHVFADISNGMTLLSLIDSLVYLCLHYIEILSFNSQKDDDITRFINMILEQFSNQNTIRFAAHSIFGTSQALIQKIAKLSNHTSIHINEQNDENSFAMSGDGAIRQFLESLDVWDKNWQIRGCSPLEFLSQLSFPSDALMVHNLHSEHQTEAQISAFNNYVFCPRSNYFLHRKLPDISRYLSANRNCCFGTDSMASNDDLSILHEIQFCRDKIGIDNSILFKMATENAARALCLPNLGTVDIGKDFVCNLFSRNVLSDNPIQSILDNDYDDIRFITA